MSTIVTDRKLLTYPTTRGWQTVGYTEDGVRVVAQEGSTVSAPTQIGAYVEEVGWDVALVDAEFRRLSPCLRLRSGRKVSGRILSVNEAVDALTTLGYEVA